MLVLTTVQVPIVESRLPAKVVLILLEVFCCKQLAGKEARAFKLSNLRHAVLRFARSNIRNSRTNAAGPKAPAGENVPRATGSGLMAVRRRSA